MRRKRILWLVSWYPNKNDRFNGDFVQRHAKAAAIHNDIHVIFVTEAGINQPEEEACNTSTGLTEQIIYYKSNKGLVGRIMKQWKWRKMWVKAIKEYINKNAHPDFIHVHIPWKVGIIALFLNKKYKLPYIISEHWGMYTHKVKDNFHAKSGIVQKLIRNIYAQSKGLISVSNYLSESIQRTLDMTMKSIIIPNVVDTSLFYYKEEKYSTFTFIHVSNMVPLKNVRIILSAFKEFLTKNINSDFQLVLIGNKDDEYIKFADGLGILNKTVFFRGEVSYREVAEEMRKSHCFLLFSDTETFSCVTAEALCCGLPVIAPEAGALPELVDQSNGILVLPKDQNELISAMVRLYSNYSYFDKIGIAQAATKRYSYSTVADKFNDLYSSKFEN